jgi:hypothetical protein
MSCARLSLFTNVTRDPADTVTAFGETPLDVMVIVAALVPAVVVLVGEVGVEAPPSPPHAAAINVPSTDVATRHEIRQDPLCI